MKAMLFHLTSDDHIRIINEQGPAETDTAGTTVAKRAKVPRVSEGMADQAIGRDLEPFAGSACSGSLHQSQDRDCTHPASHSTPNRSRSSKRAAHFKSALYCAGRKAPR